MIPVEERVRTDPAAPVIAARRHERHHPDPLIPPSVEFADHGKDSDCAADVGLGVFRHDYFSESCRRRRSLDIVTRPSDESRLAISSLSSIATAGCLGLSGARPAAFSDPTRGAVACFPESLNMKASRKPTSRGVQASPAAVRCPSEFRRRDTSGGFRVCSRA
jgi:hypothetical protein